MRPLCVLLSTDTYPPDLNRASRSIERLAIGLAGSGHDIHVLAPSPDGTDSRTRLDGVTVHRVRSLRCPGQRRFRICPPWQAGTAASQLVRELSPDIVHVHSHMLLGRAAALASTLYRFPLVATNHVLPDDLVVHARIPRWLQGGVALWAWQDLRRVYRRAQVITVPARDAAEVLERATGLSACVIPDGAELGTAVGAHEQLYHLVAGIA